MLGEKVPEMSIRWSMAKVWTATEASLFLPEKVSRPPVSYVIEPAVRVLHQSETVLDALGEKAVRACELNFPTLRCSGSSPWPQPALFRTSNDTPLDLT